MQAPRLPKIRAAWGAVASIEAMRRRSRRLLWLLLAALIVDVVAVNLAIRSLGGSPSLVSPWHLGSKHRALGNYAWHRLRHAWTPCEQVRFELVQAAHRHRVPSELVLAVARAESDLVPHRVSHAGAMGVMQLVSGTAASLGVDDPFDVRQSADGGARLLAQLWQTYGGDRARIAAAYNAGPGRVPRRGPLDVPGETRAYVERVVRESAPRRK